MSTTFNYSPPSPFTHVYFEVQLDFLLFLFFLVGMSPHSYPSKNSRNTHKWCAVIKKPGSAWPKHQWRKQILRMFGPELTRINSLIHLFISRAKRSFKKLCGARFSFLRRQPRNFENTTLVARRREHFRGFLAIFLVAHISPKRSVLVNKKLGKTWGPKTLWFFTLKKHAIKSHLQALVLGLVRSDISGHEKVAGHPNGALYFHESQEHAIFSILYNL